MKKGPFPKLDLTNSVHKKPGTAGSKTVQKLALLRKELIRDPSKEYCPENVAYFPEIPTVCPYDAEKLLYLTNIQKPNLKIHEGACCIRCSRLFLKTKSKKPSKAPTPIGETIGKSLAPPITPPKELQTYSGGQKGGVSFLNAPGKLPASTILVAKIEYTEQKNQREAGSIAVVADVTDQRSAEGIYWVGRSLASTILAAIQTNRLRCFDYRGTRYRVAAYDAYRDTQKYLTIIARFCNPVAPQEVYVFAHKNVSHFDSDCYEMVSAMVPCANREFPVPISVYYDQVKRRYFINEVTYMETRQKYGLPYMRLRMTERVVGKSMWMANLKQHSELYLLGYSVSVAGGLTEEARRKVLAQAIDSGVMCKAEIISHLEWLVKTNEGRELMVNAVGEWKTDLSYIRKYQAEKQRLIWVSSFKSRYSNGKKMYY